MFSQPTGNLGDLCQTVKYSAFIFFIFDPLVIPKFVQVLNKCCLKKIIMISIAHTAHNFGCDFVLLVHFLGHPVGVVIKSHQSNVLTRSNFHRAYLVIQRIPMIEKLAFSNLKMKYIVSLAGLESWKKSYLFSSIMHEKVSFSLEQQNEWVLAIFAFLKLSKATLQPLDIWKKRWFG